MRRAMGGSVLGEVIVTGLATIVEAVPGPKGIRHEIVSYVETGKFKADQLPTRSRPPAECPSAPRTSILVFAATL